MNGECIINKLKSFEISVLVYLADARIMTKDRNYGAMNLLKTKRKVQKADKTAQAYHLLFVTGAHFMPNKNSLKILSARA